MGWDYIVQTDVGDEAGPPVAEYVTLNKRCLYRRRNAWFAKAFYANRIQRAWSPSKAYDARLLSGEKALGGTDLPFEIPTHLPTRVERTGGFHSG